VLGWVVRGIRDNAVREGRFSVYGGCPHETAKCHNPPIHNFMGASAKLSVFTSNHDIDQLCLVYVLLYEW